MDIEINTFDGVVLKTKGKYVETDINLFVSDKAFEEILYDGEVENGTLGANKLASYFNGTITEVTEEDLKGATKIGEYVFHNNLSLKSIEIPNTVTSIGQYACDGSGLQMVIMGDNVASIGQYAFWKCQYLTSVTILNSVTKIETMAFSLCSKLTNITIGKDILNIASTGLAIGSSTNKATITFLGTTPPTISSSTFIADRINKIIVPKGYGEVYKTATNWSNFADYIVEATE